MLRAVGPFFLFHASIAPAVLACMSVLDIGDALDWHRDAQRKAAHGR